jgi:hypothetical protein
VCKPEKHLTDLTNLGNQESVVQEPQTILNLPTIHVGMGNMLAEFICGITRFDLHYQVIINRQMQCCSDGTPIALLVKELDGNHDRASATVLSWPSMYLIVMSYCDKNSCQCNCHCDRSFWMLKFSRVLWSVYTKKCMPSRSALHFFSALMIARSSFSWTG